MFDDVPVGCVLFAEGISDQTVAELVVRDNDAGANGQLTVTHTEDQGSSESSVACVLACHLHVSYVSHVIVMCHPCDSHASPM